MALRFDWAALSDKDLIQQIKNQINVAINSDKNADRVGAMHITELNFGKTGPEIEIQEITELSDSKVKTSISFSYEGDATLTFYSRVQLNPFFSASKVGARGRRHLGIYDSDSSLTAPIYITLSNFKLEGKLVIGFEKPYVVVSLKNEALKDVVVNSSFDGCSASSQVAAAIRTRLMQSIKHLIANPIRVRMN